jgi:hypothetical protein
MKLILQTDLHKCTQQSSFIILFSISLLSIFSHSKAVAQGNLLISPRRMVFEGQNKMLELNLANNGKDTARYLISFMEIRMKEDGTFEQINQPDSGQYFASSYLRLFPHSVTLAPNEAQVVKLQLIKSSQLVHGEYRSHMYFRAVPDERPLGEKSPGNDSTSISVRLIPVFGLTIPVIIRVGETTVNVRISDLSLTTGEDMQPRLNMVFNRTGNASVYGDLTVDYISPQGVVTQVGIINGIAVYTPVPSRSIRIPLDKTAGVDYKTGKLHVVYATPPDAKSVKIAESELILF